MKTIVDLSVTACRRSVNGFSPPQGGPTAPNLALDFTSGVHRLGPSSMPLSDIVTATRASTATYVDATGTIQTAAANEARTGHHIWRDAAWRRRLLVEEQATNLKPWSSDFSQGNTRLALDLVAGTTPAPDGSGAMTLLRPTGALGGHRLTYSAAPSGAVTVTLFAKAAGYHLLRLGRGFDPGAAAVFDLAAGTVVHSPTLARVGTDPNVIAASIEPFPNGVYRIRYTQGGDDVLHVSVNLSQVDGGAQAFVGDGVSGIEVWGLQEEVGAIPTSYIATSGAQVTRAADAVQIDAGKWPFSPNGVTIAMRGEATHANTGQGAVRPYSASASSGEFFNAWFAILPANPTGRIRITTAAGGATTILDVSLTEFLPGANVPWSLAARHGPTSARVAVDGVLASGDVPTAGMPAVGAAPLILMHTGSGVVSRSLTLESLRIWATPLTDSQLGEASA